MAERDDAPSTCERTVVAWSGGAQTYETRVVVAEEPLEIFVDGVPAATLMRTPGGELHLAAGFCLSEGLVERRGDVATIGYCRDVESNRIDVRRSRADLPPPAERTQASRTSCGLCGRLLIDELVACLTPVPDGDTVAPGLLAGLGASLRERQAIFAETGGTHATLLASEDGTVLAFGEDVGRHNALDKAIGALFLQESLDEARLAVLSSRLSFEMVQKAIRAGVSILAGVSAPTSLAISLADRFGLTLVGFLRGDEMTVYCGPERLTS